MAIDPTGIIIAGNVSIKLNILFRLIQCGEYNERRRLEHMQTNILAKFIYNRKNL
jgi:hypothetical protein